jgi:Flp pilus assembly protein protease CpaA
MASPNSPQNVQDLQARAVRNRLRLIILFVVFPLYKTADFMIQQNYAMMIIMLIVSILYVGLVLKLVSGR